MRVVILTQWYPPEPALLMQELAQTLQERGNEVTVVTGFPNYPSGALYPGYGIRPWRRETLNDVEVLRVALYPEHSRSAVKRVANYLSFAVSAALTVPFLLRRPDVLFVYHPPLTVGVSAIWLSWIWRVPFVYQVQDLWPETLRATGMLTSPRLLAVIDGVARRVYRRARAICVISRGFASSLAAKGVPGEKVHVVSNWVDTTVYRPVERDAALAANLGMAGRFNVMFAGNMGEAQGLETVIDAAGLLRDVPAIQFVLVGGGVAADRLRALACERQLDNVSFTGPRAVGEMAGLYALADVLLVHLKDDPLFRITIPHKIFAYMASGKPLLAAIEGDAADVVTAAGAGVVCEPENPHALSAAVRRLYALPQSERDRMATNGLEAIRQHFARDELVGRLEAILAKAMA